MAFQRVKELYQEYGNHKYMISENITQISHVIQAAKLAEKYGAPNCVIIGLLLHDIGQLIIQSRSSSEVDINTLHAQHDDVGADWLQSQGFGKIVCDIVRYHTFAKVVLIERDPQYLSRLSQASQDSYLIQKEKYRNHDRSVITELHIACRIIDDISKLPDEIYDIEDLESYREMFYQVLSTDPKLPKFSRFLGPIL